ncbi:MAG: pantoate--beta-alanine ligase [Alphaproteobacteria bacterium]
MAQRPQIVRTIPQLRKAVRSWRRRGKTIALVPTMGALHAGHMSLVETAKKNANRTVVSIFVNPTQFGPNEDFSIYPRHEQQDWEMLAKAKADLLYVPSVPVMYSEDFSTNVEVLGHLTSRMEGSTRPHHFAGVMTVVAKLFLQCLPDMAVFGEKDYQQLLAVQRMVLDLDMPIEILAAPIVREEDGLAMSSRNAYLSPTERTLAPRLYQVMQNVAKELSGGRPVNEALYLGRDWLEGAGLRVDYLEVRDANTLLPLEEYVNDPARLLAAVNLGQVRLIDNVPVYPMH